MSTSRLTVQDQVIVGDCPYDDYIKRRDSILEEKKVTDKRTSVLSLVFFSSRNHTRRNPRKRKRVGLGVSGMNDLHTRS